MNPVSQGTIFLVPGLGGLTMAQLPISSSQSHVLMASPGLPGGMRVNLLANMPSVGVPVKTEPVETQPPAVDLYLCDTSRDGGVAMAEDSKEQASVALLEQCYQLLLQHKLKDTLSSFLPDVPGDFDNGDMQESMLRTLIDRPPVGGREFMPLSDQVLLGFRLHPGPLPEQYRLDPPSACEQRHHQHKKKKHKHRNLEKVDEMTLDSYSPAGSRDHSPPVDPCSFIRTEHTTNFFHQPVLSMPTAYHAPPIIPVMGTTTQMKFVSAANILSQQSVAPAAQSVIVDRLPPTLAGSIIGVGGSLSAEHLRLHAAEKRAKKKRHENGEGVPKKKKKKDKDRKDKDKDRKRKRHHNQDPSHSAPLALAVVGAPGPPPLILASYPPRD